MEDPQTNPQDEEDALETDETAVEAAPPTRVEEKKPEGIEHDPYEWGKCAIAAHIVWLPDGSVMLGVRSHLDAPIITLLPVDALVTLPGHAAELPIPAVDAIANLLAQLREELPLRAKARVDRADATRRKADEAKNKQTSGKKNAKPASTAKAATSAAASLPTDAPVASPTAPAGKITLPPAGKSPAATQVSLFNFMTGGN